MKQTSYEKCLCIWPGKLWNDMEWTKAASFNAASPQGKASVLLPSKFTVLNIDKATFYFCMVSPFSTKMGSAASSQESSGFSRYNLALGSGNRGFPRLLSIITLPCRADSGERARWTQQGWQYNTQVSHCSDCVLYSPMYKDWETAFLLHTRNYANHDYTGKQYI